MNAAAAVGDVFAYEAWAQETGVARSAISVTVLASVPMAAAVAERATPHGSFGAVGGSSLVVLAAALALLPRRSQEARRTQVDEVETSLRQRMAGMTLNSPPQ